MAPFPSEHVLISEKEVAESIDNAGDGYQLKIETGEKPVKAARKIKATPMLQVFFGQNSSYKPESKDVGVSPISESLKEYFESYPILFWRAAFVEKSIESEFLMSYSLKAISNNKQIYLIGTIGGFLYAATIALVNGVYFDTYLIAFQTGFCFAILIVWRWLPESFVKRYHHHWFPFIMAVSYSPIFIGSYHFNARRSVDEDFQVFRSFIYSTSVCMIYGASTVMQLRTSSALYITLYFVLAPWITIVISTGTTNPLQFIAVPVFYGTIGFFCLWTVRNREYKLRRIYIMEKLYSQRFNIDIDTVCNMPTFAFHHRRLTKCFEGDIKCLEIPTIKLNRWPRFKKWFRRDVLLTWDDLNIERTYLAWRQAGFLSYMRQTVFLLAIFDLYSALMDPISFCELKGSHAKSPSMCGEKGEILRNIRLCLLPVILASFGISFSKCIREYSSGSQNLFLIVLSLRGLALLFMLALIIRWDRRDETGFIILSALISQFFIVCGSSALLIDKLIIHCGVLLAGAVTTIIANKEGQIFMLMLIFVVISLCVYYGIQMERHEHRFFAMWEVLCGNDVEV